MVRRNLDMAGKILHIATTVASDDLLVDELIKYPEVLKQKLNIFYQLVWKQCYCPFPDLYPEQNSGNMGRGTKI